MVAVHCRVMPAVCIGSFINCSETVELRTKWFSKSYGRYFIELVKKQREKPGGTLLLDFFQTIT